MVHRADDPDACSETLALTGDEADALAEMLGAPRIVARLTELALVAAGGAGLVLTRRRDGKSGEAGL